MSGRGHPPNLRVVSGCHHRHPRNLQVVSECGRHHPPNLPVPAALGCGRPLLPRPQEAAARPGASSPSPRHNTRFVTGTFSSSSPHFGMRTAADYEKNLHICTQIYSRGSARPRLAGCSTRTQSKKSSCPRASATTTRLVVTISPRRNRRGVWPLSSQGSAARPSRGLRISKRQSGGSRTTRHPTSPSSE